ncbi:hypothetical protein [Actinomadura sp. 21ATH]|uniref:hypothetical protein n=1 Tax=Actinomadura sp. 21ATH TaxID=1735444 RepID=UPI0035C25C67
MTEAAPSTPPVPPVPAVPGAFAPRLAPGIGPDGTYTLGGQITAFLLGLYAMVVFFPALIAAALLYTWAEERFERDPAGARTRVIWSWICVTAGPVVGLLAALLVGGLVYGIVRLVTG